MSSLINVLVLDTSPAAQRRCNESLRRGAYYHRRSCWAWWIDGPRSALRWGHGRLRGQRLRVGAVQVVEDA